MEKSKYQIEYEEFMNNYKSGTIGGEQIGLQIGRWGQYYGETNARYGEAQEKFNAVYEKIIQADDSNGKPISVAKAEIFAKSTPEYIEFIRAKTELTIIDRQIGTLQSFQKGVMSEYNNV